MKKMDNERLDAVSEMLLAMAHGDFSHRILLLDKRDWFDTLVVQLNMVAEELENSLFHQNYINKDETYINRTYIFLNLDKKDRIIQYNPETTLLLRHGDDQLLGCPITRLLSRASRERWKAFKASEISNMESDQQLQLEFRVKERLLLKLAFNTIPMIPNNPLSGHTQLAGSHIRMLDVEGQDRSQRIRTMAEMYSASKQLYCDPGLENKGIPLSREDRVIIQEVANHLQNRLQEPMDSLVSLAKAFGTNTFKLKYGFKKVKGETISRYLQHKRLNAAVLLLEHTELSVMAIADMCGFVNPSHFSVSFKKKYGESPKNYRKTFLAAIKTQIIRLKTRDNPLEK